MNFKYGFKIVKKGYDPAEVDAYIDEQLSRMTAMKEQNTTLLNKLSQAQDMIRHYSGTEKALRKSIADSKKGAADLIYDASERSTNLVDTAREECNRIANEIDEVVSERTKALDEIKDHVLRFKQELFNLYSDHINMIETLADTAINFKYEPDYTTLAEAIDTFEEGVANLESVEVPTFPQYPENGFFEVVPEKAEIEAVEALADIAPEKVTEDEMFEDEVFTTEGSEPQTIAEFVPSEMEFGFEEADQLVEMEAVTPNDDIVTGDEFEDMFFEVDEAPNMDTVENVPDFEQIVAPPMNEAEIDEDDDMFYKSDEDVKKNDDPFSFLMNFINETEE